MDVVVAAVIKGHERRLIANWVSLIDLEIGLVSVESIDGMDPPVVNTFALHPRNGILCGQLRESVVVEYLVIRVGCPSKHRLK